MKVLIVGGSIAGLATAYELTKLSPEARITILERKKEIGKPTICAQGVATFKMRSAGIKFPLTFIERSLKAASVSSPNGNHVDIRGPGAYGYIIWREGYEKWLAKYLQRKGVRIKLGHVATGMDLPGYDAVIGADGVGSIVRRTINLDPPPPKDLYLASQCLAKIENLRRDTVYLYFGSVAPKGYAWFFPTGLEDIFRAGLGVASSTKIDPVNALKKFLSRQKIVSPISVKPIPSTMPPKRLVFDNILLVGDAGLQTDPLTGGGICNAIIGAKCAARAIAEDDLRAYDRNWKAKLYLENTMKYRLKRILSSLTDQEFNEAVGALKDIKTLPTGGIKTAIAQAVLLLTLKKPSLIMRKKLFRRIFLNRGWAT